MNNDYVMVLRILNLSQMQFLQEQMPDEVRKLVDLDRDHAEPSSHIILVQFLCLASQSKVSQFPMGGCKGLHTSYYKPWGWHCSASSYVVAAVCSSQLWWPHLF
jgi:hypothetical protein